MNSVLANSRAKVNNETDGFVKILADSKTDKVLGVPNGPHCGDMIAEMALAMEFGAAQRILQELATLIQLIQRQLKKPH